MYTTYKLPSQKTRIQPNTKIRFESHEPLWIEETQRPTRDNKGMETVKEAIVIGRLITGKKAVGEPKTWLVYGRNWDLIETQLKLQHSHSDRDVKDTSTWFVLFDEKARPFIIWD